MKKSALTVIMSVLLILASLFGLAAAGLGIKDGLAIKEYKEADAETAEVVGELEEAIGLLKENEEAYAQGTLDYAQGVVDYAAGEKELAAGYDTYNAGKKQLEDGYAQYEAGKKALAEGKKQVAEGQALIDANTDAYNEGKETLSKIEPLLPYVEQYVQFRDGSVAKLPGFNTAQAWFMAVVRPIAAQLGLDIPEDVTDFPAYIQQMVADGKAQLKEYEDGLAALEEGKKQVAEGEKQLAEAKKQLEAGEAELAAGKKELDAGEAQLADGAAQLADGLNSLKEFEDGMALVDEYTMVCYKNEPIYRFDGEMAVPGPEQRLGEDYSWYKLDEDGNVVTLRNGDPYLDLDKCLEVCASFRASVDEQVADVTHELYMRLALYIALAVAGIIGVVAGVLGLAGKAGAATLGVITALILVASNVFGLCTRYLGYTYPLKDGTYSGTLQLIALLVFLGVSVVFAIVALSAKKRAKIEAEVQEYMNM